MACKIWHGAFPAQYPNESDRSQGISDVQTGTVFGPHSSDLLLLGTIVLLVMNIRKTVSLLGKGYCALAECGNSSLALADPELYFMGVRGLGVPPATVS